MAKPKANHAGGEIGDDRVERLRKAAYDDARRRGVSEPDAEDCVQECILRLLQSLGPELSPGVPVATVEAWLRAALRHDVQDEVRRAAATRQHVADPSGESDEEERAPEWDAPDAGPTPEEAVEQEFVRERLFAAIGSLDPTPYVCFVLREMLYWETKEIAEALEQKENQISKVLARAKAQLRRRLEGEGLTLEEVWSCLHPPARTGQRRRFARER